MKQLLFFLVFFLAASLSFAGESIQIQFEYDDQQVPEYVARSVGVAVNGAMLCTDDNPSVGPDDVWNYECGDYDFPPGDYEFSIVVTDSTGTEISSALVMATVPPLPVVLPPRKNPVIKKITIERDGEGVIVTVEPV